MSRRFLRIIKTWIVSGSRAAWCKEIVSCPPEKILSTETDEPKQHKMHICKHWVETDLEYWRCPERGVTSLGTVINEQPTT